MFRRELLTELGGMDEALRYNEDSDFLQRVAIAYQGTYVDFPSVRHYHHSENKSSDRLAISNALLTSATNVLDAFPSFAHQLGARADERLSELHVSRIEQLVVLGQFERARALAATSTTRLPAAVRLSIAMGRAAPVNARRFIRRAIESAAVRLHNGLLSASRSRR
jgi:hypothetical protein